MNIGKIKLSEWNDYKTKTFEENDYGQNIYHRKSIRFYRAEILRADLVGVAIYEKPDSKKCTITFYLALFFLENLFKTTTGNNISIIDGDLEFSKQYIDAFLIKMGKLTAFM